MHLNPSSFGSKRQPLPDGIGPARASAGWGSRSTVPDALSQDRWMFS